MPTADALRKAREAKKKAGIKLKARADRVIKRTI